MFPRGSFFTPVLLKNFVPEIRLKHKKLPFFYPLAGITEQLVTHTFFFPPPSC